MSPSSTSVTLTNTSGQDISLTSSLAGTTEISFSVGTPQYDNTSSPNIWLGVNVTNATTPATISFRVANTSLLQPGPHQATVTVTATNPAGVPNSPLTFTVNFNSSTGGGGGGSLTSSINPITLNAATGTTTSVTPTISTTSVTPIGLSTPVITISSCLGVNWLTASLSSNTISASLPVSLLVSANASGLGTGVCQGSVTLTPSVGNALTISVTLNVNGSGSGGSLTPSQSTVSFNFTTNSGNFPNQLIGLSSSTGVTLFNASTNSSGWLLANNNSQVYAQNVSSGVLVGVGSAANALSTGTYTGTITLYDYYNPTIALATISVTLSVNGGSTSGLTISPNPVTLPAAAVNGSQVQTIVLVSSVNGGVLSISTNSTGWLTAFSGANGQSLSPGAQASITLTGNPFGLTANNYVGTLTVTIGSLTSSVSVTMVVGGGGGSATGAVAPTNLSLTYQAGTNPAFVSYPSIAITGPAGNWSSSISYATGTGWLSLSPSAGTLPVNGQAMVIASPGGLSVGTYSATISITTAGGTATVTVNLNVVSGATLLTTPGSAIFTYTTGGAIPSGIQVNPAMSDGSALNFTATANDTWVTVNQQTGSTVFSVQVNPAGKSAGVYTSGVTINQSGAANTPVNFPVVLVVNGGTGSSGPLIFTPASMSFSSANGVTPTPLVLSVSANVTSPFTVSSSASWLSVSPTSGTTPVNLSVSVNPSGLASNSTNTGILTFNSNGTIQTVTVTYVVGAGGGGGTGNVTVSCTSSCGTTQPSLAFSGQAGSGSLPAGTLSVASASGSAGVQFTVQTSTTGGGAWLSTSAGSSTLTTPVNPLTVNVNASGLSAGSYSGTITIVPSGGASVSVPVSLTITAPPTVTATPTSLSFTYRLGDPAPAVQSINVSGGGAALAFTATAATTSGGNWLSVSPTSGTTPTSGTAQVTVTVNTTNLNAGNFAGTVTIAGSGGAGGSTTVNVTLSVTAPLPTVSRVVNGASYQANALSPGEVITLFASDAQHPIGPSTPVGLTLDSTGKVATTLGGVQVLINGFACPMIYVSSTQVSAVVPYEVAPLVTASVVLKYQGQSSNGVTVNIATTAPGIFTLNSSGTGPGAILNQNQSVNSPSNPDSRGNTVTIYMTGEGQTTPAGVTGKVTTVASAPPLTPSPLLAIGVTIGGQPANYVFAGEAPGIVSGVLQLNVVIPATVSAGDLPLIVSIGGVPSQTGVTISVK
ncbi:MAG TPA: hypothetical protein VMS37_25680 [Verrucomicrobiae bacterium]|nr:hypothetical protein [Verrucomicrobiae bacterium]